MKKRKMLRMIMILISVLMITVLSVSIVFLIYRNISSNNAQMEVMQKELLFNFRAKAEEALERCTKVIAAWMLDGRVMQFATEEEISYSNLTRIYKEIFGKDMLYQDLDCVFGVFRPDRDIFITNIGIIHSVNLIKICSLTSNSANYIKDLPQKEFVSNYCLADEISADGKRINVFLKRTLSDAANTDFYGFISLNLQQVAKQTSHFENHVFFAFKGEHCIFASQENWNMEQLKTFNEPSYLIYELQYLSGAKKHSSIGSWLLYGLLFMVLMVLGLFGSFFLAKRLHRPIENILQDVLGNDGANIYDEETYIRSRVAEIKTVNQEMSLRIRAQERYLKQNFVRDLLYGLVEESFLMKRLKEYHLQNLCGDVALAVLNENTDKNHAVMMFNEITETLENKFKNGLVIFLNAEQLAVIVPASKESAFAGTLMQAILQISEKHGVSYTAAVSAAKIESPAELCGLFNDAMRKLENGYFGYDRLIITEKEQPEHKEYNYYYSMDIEKNIIACLLNGDYERGMQFLEIVLKKNLIETHLGKEALVGLKFSLVATIKRVLQALKKTEEELLGEGTVLYLELSACKTPEEIRSKVREMFFAICRYRESTFAEAGHVLMDDMEVYVQENYQRSDMSLTLLAEHFNLTTSYIGKLFKRCRQVNFKDYLTEYRIQKATEVLEQQPHIRIAELAKMVGYDYVNSFNRNFKKIKKVSPSEYKWQS